MVDGFCIFARSDGSLTANITSDSRTATPKSRADMNADTPKAAQNYQFAINVMDWLLGLL